jgi:hypothetical protein
LAAARKTYLQTIQLGSFGAVFDAVSSSVQAALHRFAKLHLDLLEDIVREGSDRGQFKIRDQRPREIAMQIVAGIQGALLMGQGEILGKILPLLGGIVSGGRRAWRRSRRGVAGTPRRSV